VWRRKLINCGRFKGGATLHGGKYGQNGVEWRRKVIWVKENKSEISGAKWW
jgi:hypothetical protein